MTPDLNFEQPVIFGALVGQVVSSNSQDISVSTKMANNQR